MENIIYNDLKTNWKSNGLTTKKEERKRIKRTREGHKTRKKGHSSNEFWSPIKRYLLNKLELSIEQGLVDICEIIDEENQKTASSEPAKECSSESSLNIDTSIKLPTNNTSITAKKVTISRKPKVRAFVFCPWISTKSNVPFTSHLGNYSREELIHNSLPALLKSSMVKSSIQYIVQDEQPQSLDLKIHYISDKMAFVSSTVMNSECKKEIPSYENSVENEVKNNSCYLEQYHRGYNLKYCTEKPTKSLCPKEGATNLPANQLLEFDSTKKYQPVQNKAVDSKCNTPDGDKKKINVVTCSDSYKLDTSLAKEKVKFCLSDIRNTKKQLKFQNSNHSEEAVDQVVHSITKNIQKLKKISQTGRTLTRVNNNVVRKKYLKDQLSDTADLEPFVKISECKHCDLHKKMHTRISQCFADIEGFKTHHEIETAMMIEQPPTNAFIE